MTSPVYWDKSRLWWIFTTSTEYTCESGSLKLKQQRVSSTAVLIMSSDVQQTYRKKSTECLF